MGEKEIIPHENYDELMKNYSKRLIEWAILKSHGNKSEAADLLGMKRTTLLYKIKELNIDNF